ncbi:MAG: Gfo/Idh/MocA family oxidoreductase [Verrucomicrobiota bacterium]
MPESYRVAVIGSTGRGNYGHGLDRVWADGEGARVVAVADDDEKGLAAARGRLGAGVEGFQDYGKMLNSVRPDLVSIAPRWLDQHKEMVLASASAGVKGIYLEKPFCRDLEEADAIVAACEKADTKLAIAFQTRYSPVLDAVQRHIDDGRIGDLLELRGRGKDDRRGGGEDLWVLGSHVMNLMQQIGGEPRWCSARVLNGDRPVEKKDVYAGKEGIGPLAGNRLHATYGFDSGLTGYFDSVQDRGGTPTRFGVEIRGSKGIIQVYHGYLTPAWWLDDSSWSPGRSGKNWVQVTSQGPGQKETMKGENLHGGNVRACEDLIRAVEEDRQPEASVYEARLSNEMIAGVFESHRQGGPVPIPLENRKNPLTLL